MSRLAPRLTALLLGAIVVGGCFGNETTEFPPGLEPVEENRAPTPQGSAGDPYPERLETTHGRDDGTMFAHSRGYVHATPAAVWAALKNPDVVADRRNTDRRTITLNPEPEYEYSFLLHYEVDDIITVEWDENWRYGTLEGELADPDFAVNAFQKTFGTTFISLLKGSMSLERIEDGVVLFGMVERLDAAMTESDRPAAYQADVFANILAIVNGQPLPQF